MYKYKSFWFSLFFVLSLLGPAFALEKPSKPPFDILHYKIEIVLNEKDLSYQAANHVTFRSTVPSLEEIFLHDKEGVRKIKLPLPLRQNESITVTVQSSGKADERNQEGLFVVYPALVEGPQFFTQFESQGARKVFPCFDEPFDKATTEVILTANEKYTLLSNGKKISEEKLPGGLKRAHFKNDDPIPTYLITFAAANLKPLRDSFASQKGAIPLVIYTAPGKTADARYAMGVLKKALRHYENYFGQPYPWDAYGIIALSGFFWGGMENKGLANLNAARLLWNKTDPVYKKVQIAGLVAHELAHEWFGNMVTLYWWDDLWLNESFATFATSKFMEEEFGKDFEAIDNFRWLSTDYFPQDQGAFSHPIIPDKIDTLDELFDGITYAKGVQVVRMLEDLVTAEKFQRGLQYYFDRHRLGNATTAQFLEAIEKVSGRRLERFANGWLHQKGYPKILLSENVSLIQEGDPFEFMLNIGDQKVHVFEKHVMASLKGAEGNDIPINRGGRTLLTYTWKDRPWPQALNDSDPFVRFQTLYDLIWEQKMGEGLVQALKERLNDKENAVILGAGWAAIDSRLNPAFAQALAQSVWKTAKNSYAKLAPSRPVEAQGRGQLLTLIGQADVPEAYSFLRSEAGSSSVDDRLGAIGGLLRTNDSERYAVFAKMLQRYGKTQPAKLEILLKLAQTPKADALTRLVHYLNDPKVVAMDDSAIPTRIWRTLKQANRQVLFSEEGIDAILQFVNANKDRPSVAVLALRTLEGAKEAAAEAKGRIKQAMSALLASSPPVEVQSVAQKILAAAS